MGSLCRGIVILEGWICIGKTNVLLALRTGQATEVSMLYHMILFT